MPWSSGHTFETFLNVGENLVTFEVSDYTDTNTYTVTVNRAPSNDAMLAELSVNQGTLDPVFDKNTISYTVSVGEDVASIAIHAGVSEPHAGVVMYKVNGAQREELASGLIGVDQTAELQPGDNTFEIVVTAQDGVTQKTYSINVIRAGVPLTRLAVKIGDGEGAQVIEFDPAVLGHGFTLDSDANVYITAVTLSQSAGVFYNTLPITDLWKPVSATDWTQIGQSKIKRTDRFAIPVRVNEGTTANTYALMVNGSGGETALSGLGYQFSVDDLTTMLDVEPGKYEYSLNVASDVAKIYVFSEPADAGGCAIINGNSGNPVLGPAALGYGLNKIPITIVASNGDIATYQLNVTRPTPPEKIADVTNITVDQGTFDQPFEPDVHSYTVTVPYSYAFYQTSTDVSQAVIRVNLAEPSSILSVKESCALYVDRISGPNMLGECVIELSHLQLDEANNVAVVVRSSDGTVVNRYDLSFLRAPSNNAFLHYQSGGLQVSRGMLSPAYYCLNYDYTVDVGADVDSISLKATPYFPEALLTVNGIGTAQDTWREIPLCVGANIVNVVVTAPDGKNTKTYTVTVNRAALPDTTPPSVGVPGNITAEAASSAGAVVNFQARAIDAVDGEMPVTYSKAPGLFPMGTTTVNCTAKDSSNNSATASFDVIVQDTTPPALGPMEDIEVDAEDTDGAAVDFDITATDLVDGTVDVSCSRAPGSVFPVGTTPVTCMAEDLSGNAAVKTFRVTVNAPTMTLLSILKPSAVTGVPNGTAKTAEALGLPPSVTLVTVAGYVNASATWYVYSSSYDPALAAEQTFMVEGKVKLPAGVVNPDNVPLTTTITVTVNAALENASVAPAKCSFALSAPADVVTFITWNNASTVTDVVYGSDSLIRDSDYTVSFDAGRNKDALTIRSGYLSSLLKEAGKSAEFEIIFDVGQSARLTVNAVDNYVPGSNPPTWPADSILTASGTTRTKTTLSWTPAEDDVAVTGYRIFRVFRDNPNSLIETVTGAVYRCDVTGLTPSTTYTFMVQAGDKRQAGRHHHHPGRQVRPVR